MFYADLHVHSKYSLATSSDCDLEHLALWACRKGITVVGSGDFTHPGWLKEIREKLTAAEPGLYRLRPGIEKQVRALTASSFIPHPSSFCPPRFMLQVEISTVYRKDGRTRKVHHIVYVPDLDCARRLIRSLKRFGKLSSDGRPTLGLDSRDLLEMVLDSGEGCCLIPAHIWTPWFGVLGSKSGFDSIEECYGDLASEVFALETGLSSDPAMNWRLSNLDRYALVSNSDAHSPAKLGREACVFNTKLDYFSMFRALKGTGPICRHGDGDRSNLPERPKGCFAQIEPVPLAHKLAPSLFLGTVEFFPEEGKYYNDGHRKCGVCLTPEETRRCGGKCPVCGKPITLGVMHRVGELADRPDIVGCVNHTDDIDSGAFHAPYKPGDSSASSKITMGKMPVPHDMPVPHGPRMPTNPPVFSGPRAAPFRSLIPLSEVLSEIHKVGSKSKFVRQKYGELLEKLGPELFVLEKALPEDISRIGSSLLAEAISRMRAGRVICRPGFDGEYGKVRLFSDEELKEEG